MNPQSSNKTGPTRSSVDLNAVTTVVFVVTLVALAALSVQLKVLTLDQGPSGTGHGHGGNGTGNGTGMGKGAGSATTAQGGGNGGAGVNDSSQKLGYGPGGGGGSGFVKPQVVQVKNSTPSSSPVDRGHGGAGQAQGKDLDKKEKVYTAGGVQLGTNSSSGGGGGHNGVQVPQIQMPEKLKWLLLIITIVAIVVAAGVLVTSYMKARQESLRKAARSHGKGKRKKTIPDGVASAVTDEFIQTIEMTYDALEKMGDVRKAITICYARLCGVIADKGLIRSPDITPREFYSTVRKAFNIDSTAMKGLTLLFEEAVYSEHALSEAHRDKALKLLKGAVEEVKGW